MENGSEPGRHELTTQPQGASWSPDGKRIAFFNVDGMWRVAQIWSWRSRAAGDKSPR